MDLPPTEPCEVCGDPVEYPPGRGEPVVCSRQCRERLRMAEELEDEYGEFGPI